MDRYIPQDMTKYSWVRDPLHIGPENLLELFCDELFFNKIFSTSLSSIFCILCHTWQLLSCQFFPFLTTFDLLVPLTLTPVKWVHRKLGSSFLSLSLYDRKNRIIFIYSSSIYTTIFNNLHHFFLLKSYCHSSFPSRSPKCFHHNYSYLLKLLNCRLLA